MIVRAAPLPQLPDEQIEHVLSMSGHPGRTIVAMRHLFPRWRRWLASQGVTSLPSSIHSQVPEEARGVMLVTQLALQASSDRKDKSTEHRLRNLTETRPFKP